MQTTDISAGRHGGSETSIEANRIAERGKNYWRSRVVIYATRRKDFTLKEICSEYGRPLNALSGRLSELKRDGVLVNTGSRRDGCAVLTLAPSLVVGLAKVAGAVIRGMAVAQAADVVADKLLSDLSE